MIILSAWASRTLLWSNKFSGLSNWARTAGIKGLDATLNMYSESTFLLCLIPSSLLFFLAFFFQKKKKSPTLSNYSGIRLCHVFEIEKQKHSQCFRKATVYWEKERSKTVVVKRAISVVTGTSKVLLKHQRKIAKSEWEV